MEKTKIIKKALAYRWGYKNVSVRRGKGTAAPWIEATVTIEKPVECFCFPGHQYCPRCREAMREAHQEALKRVYAAMQVSGAKFETYFSNDGFNTERDCFLLQVLLKRDQK